MSKKALPRHRAPEAMRAKLIGLAALVSTAWVFSGVVLSEGSLRVPRRPSDAQEEIASFDGVKLRGVFKTAPGASACVLVLHGIGDSSRGALGFAPMFLDAGYSVFAPDSRAHGASDGELVTFGIHEAKDILRWAAWLRERGCGRVYGLGESLGGAALIQAAAQEPAFAAIVAECPYSDLRSIAEYRVTQTAGAWLAVPVKAAVASAMLYTRARYGVDLNAASPVESARGLQTPLLLIHGLADHNTPPSHSQAIAAANPRIATWFVPGATHTAAAFKEPAEFRRRVLSWFGSH
ncbi:MAG TPA: hypothetical protein DEH78_17850 [Solibacterales bacterium]|nr:hypothetical protein [Bryobacterales bacterium]